MWAVLSKDERRGRALEALRKGGLRTLLDLMEHHLRTWGRAGAKASPNTLRSYRSAVRGFFAWLQGMGLEEEALAQAVASPSEDLGAAYLRHLEEEGLKPASVNQRRAALRAFYEALKWAGVAERNPFSEAPTRRDPVPKWEKRRPYEEKEVARLLEAATLEERLLVLLGAQGGLRVSEAVGLRWENVDLEARRMRVVGKGRKEASVLIPGGLARALEEAKKEEGPVLPWRSDDAARRALKRLCQRAGVPYRGYHALRHYCGTHLYRSTRDIQTVARHLRHSGIATTTIYAKWGEEEAKRVLEAWE